MRPPRSKDYLWAEVGALLGAVASVPVAAGVVQIILLVFGYESLEDLARSVAIGLGAGALLLILGSSFGCWYGLKRAGYPAAKSAARMFFLLLVVFYLSAVVATKEGRASVLLPAIVVPFAMPLLATWITGLVPRPAAIQILVLLVAGAGAYGSFARSSDVAIPVPPVETPAVEEKTSAPSQIPLGSKNPCWAGTYPDDLGFLEAEEMPVRTFLVDPEAGDIYYPSCIRIEVSKGANWPPGVAERLLSSTDPRLARNR
jgi:hypothetical protein